MSDATLSDWLAGRDRFVDRHVGPRAEDIAEMLQALGFASLDELIDAGGAGDLDIQKVHDRGIAPGPVINDYVEAHAVDLIVMGKRGRSDPDKPAFGTITNRVIGSTDALVLTV